MHSVALICHPSTPCAAALGITVHVDFSGGELLLSFVLTGEIAALRVPLSGLPQRMDGLWQATCCEAFLRRQAEPAYCEFNFSPSTAWAMYRFESYREGMAAIDSLAPPLIAAQLDAHRLELQVKLNLDGLPLRNDGSGLSLALSAVIEEQSGQISYWALAHPPGKPDFHHPDGFAIQLEPQN